MTRLGHIILFFCTLLVACGELSCSRESPASDHPRLAPGVALHDVTFYSKALGRNMQYRVLLPEGAGKVRLRVVYLLHGGGGNFRDWSNYSNVAEYAGQRFLLVMPEGNSSYYVNAVSPPEDRYEDYIVDDLAADVEKRFPARSDRDGRAIAGVSMGGFGAVNLGLRHPDRFAFVGALSSAIDVPRRRFTWRRLEQSRRFDRLFGADGSDTRRERDPYKFVESVDNTKLPYFYLTCGTQEGLLPANREFAARLEKYNISHEFHVIQGGHDWNQWNGLIKSMFIALATKLPTTLRRT